MPTEPMIDPETHEVVKDKNGEVKMIGVINNINSDLFNVLRESYFGGHVDMYLPAGTIADNIGLVNLNIKQ